MYQIPFFIKDFPDHEKHKYKILSLMMQEEGLPINESSPEEGETERIIRTDWRSTKNIKEKKYVQYVLDVLDKDLREIFKSMGYHGIRYQGMWFQQYNRLDFHSWHRHHNSEWNFVYYLEFAKDCPATEFRNPLNKNETFIPEVTEGQYVLFPSLLAHRSAPNQSRERKTVIAMNISTS
jgi:hypothetical protein